MEAFGHASAGLVLAQLVRPVGDGQPRFWALVGVAGALAPDIDAITWLIGGPALFRAHHQIYTHNLFISAVVPPLLGALAHRRAPIGASRSRVVALVCAAWGSHLLGDTIASWPLKLLWPLSDRGVALGLLDQDFSLVLPAILGFGAALSFVDEVAPHRRWVAGGTLGAALIYLAFGPGW